MNIAYPNIGNKYELDNNVAIITVLKKNGTELITKIDAADLDLIKDMGTWFAEWNKDYNNYIIQNISSTKRNKKSKPLKQSLQSVILNVNPKAPIKYKNGDTLDNRRSNLEVVDRNIKNEYEEKDNIISIILKDKLGKKESIALISSSDLDRVISDDYIWVLHKTHGKISVVANTPNGRIHLDTLLTSPGENETINHKNHNPLDCRRDNLEIISEEK